MIETYYIGQSVGGVAKTTYERVRVIEPDGRVTEFIRATTTHWDGAVGDRVVAAEHFRMEDDVPTGQ